MAEVMKFEDFKAEGCETAVKVRVPLQVFRHFFELREVSSDKQLWQSHSVSEWLLIQMYCGFTLGKELSWICSKLHEH